MAAMTEARRGVPVPPYRKSIIASIAVLAACDIAYLLVWLSHGQQPPFSDFFGLWSFGRFARTAGSAIYNPVALQAFQHHLDPAFHGSYPYPYPPTALLFLVPFGLMPLTPAYVLWIATTFALYACATLGRDWHSLWGAVLLVAPTTLLTVITGQNGFLTAALLVGGLRSLPRSWLTAGLAFGVLTYKPQFGMVIPVILLATANWRTILTAFLTVVLLGVLSSALFGGSLWLTWLQGIPLYRHLLALNEPSLSHLMPTILAGMRAIGAAEPVAYAVQFGVAAAVAIVMWQTARRGWDDRTIASVIVATVLVTPYAFTYDMPMITAALVIEARRRERSGVPVRPWELVTVILLFAVFEWMSVATLPLAAPILLAVVFLVLASGKLSGAITS